MDLEAFTDGELEALEQQVAAERGRRWAEATAAQRAEQVRAQADDELDRIAAMWRASARSGTGTEVDPVPWEAPTGAHDVWPLGSFVTHGGRVWFNPHPASSWEPGVVGAPWVDVTPTVGTPAWGTGQVVAVGDERTHDGRTWRAKVAHTTHEGWVPGPASYTIWKLATP